jgi:rubrerythrin
MRIMKYKDVDPILEKLDSLIIDGASDDFNDGVQTAINIIEEEYTPEISRPIGRWKKKYIAYNKWCRIFYYCSECGHHEDIQWNFCPVCGAVMID